MRRFISLLVGLGCCLLVCGQQSKVDSVERLVEANNTDSTTLENLKELSYYYSNRDMDKYLKYTVQGDKLAARMKVVKYEAILGRS